MSNKNVLIICQSIHHGNTMKVAKVIAEELNADIKKPFEIKPGDINKYDVIGFGSGIYEMTFHESLLKLVKKFSCMKNKKAFIFSTKWISPTIFNHKQIKILLLEKKFKILSEFSCKGLATYLWAGDVFGGLNKKRPNEKDLKKAKKFALKIKDSF